MKNKIKIILAFVLGLIISGVTVYAITITGRDVTYDNTNSGMQSTDVQGAVDELYTKIDNAVLATNRYILTGGIGTTTTIPVTCNDGEAIFIHAKGYATIDGTYISTYENDQKFKNISRNITNDYWTFVGTCKGTNTFEVYIVNAWLAYPDNS